MPPKGRGRGRGRRAYHGVDNSTEEVFDIISVGDGSDSSDVVMTGHQRVKKKQISGARGRGRGHSGRLQSSRSVVPEVFHELLDEAMSSPAAAPERPPKRRKLKRTEETEVVEEKDAHTEEEDNFEFEDVIQPNEQTAYRDSDEDSNGSDIPWEDFDLAEHQEESGDLDITLNTTPQQKTAVRRKTVSKADLEDRLVIHKMHILCLLSHVARRNEWCNDEEVQKALRPLLKTKVAKDLRPEKAMSQFRRTDLLKQGLEAARLMWATKFKITARGIRRAHWEEDLKNFKLPSDLDPPMGLHEFRNAAKNLKGSRDLGAQLFCALLRSVGLDVRLVCSLQPLSFGGGNSKGQSIDGSLLSRQHESTGEFNVTSTERESGSYRLESGGPASQLDSGGPFSARRRLGHPNAADYYLPLMQPPPTTVIPKVVKQFHESPYPVYWVEVLDEAHQKWQPVDAVVMHSHFKTNFEPPAADKDNSMAYVVAFGDVGAAKDVTRRYARAYNSKTRKTRVDIKWFGKVMNCFTQEMEDLDQIEDSELAGLEAREPMPKSVVDFKGHPRYALERHLRKNEVLINRHEIAKIRAGKKMESVYRRSDVSVVRSADRWYRMGRDVKVGEQPVRIIEGKNEGMYTETQTEVYEPPPVIRGRVPRNAYGNLDVYVPSMVPRGGIHIRGESLAARLIGVDYADAIVGFKFEGRHGRPVIDGFVVAEEYKEAIEVVIEGIQDMREMDEEKMRGLRAVVMWKRFLVGLRIKARVDEYDMGDEDNDEKEGGGFENDTDEEEYNEDEGGGFIVD